MLKDRMHNLFLLLIHPIVYIVLQAIVFTLELNEKGNILNPIVIFLWLLILLQKETWDYFDKLTSQLKQSPNADEHKPEEFQD